MKKIKIGATVTWKNRHGVQRGTVKSIGEGSYLVNTKINNKPTRKAPLAIVEVTGKMIKVDPGYLEIL